MLVTYEERKPSASLAPFIDAYWKLEIGLLHQPLVRNIFPDGCIDIIANIGASSVFLQSMVLKPGNVYLAGTMTSLTQVNRLPHTCLIGIRFKPAAFPSFYAYPLEELTDQVIELQDPGLAQLLRPDPEVFDRLDGYFQRKKSDKANPLLAITNQMYASGGQLPVHYLAQMHHLTLRSLERAFKKNIGVTPKKLSRIIRFQSVIHRLQHPISQESLAAIALEMGYYDQAHFSNEVKKYAGLNPTQLS